MDMGLAGKSVVVTGGASNIGRSIVLAFADEGANITIGDIDLNQAEKVGKLAIKRGAAGVQVVRTDVTDLIQVQAMFQAATKKFGCVDVLGQADVLHADDAGLLAEGHTDQLCWRAQLHQGRA